MKPIILKLMHELNPQTDEEIIEAYFAALIYLYQDTYGLNTKTIKEVLTDETNRNRCLGQRTSRDQGRLCEGQEDDTGVLLESNPREIEIEESIGRESCNNPDEVIW